MKDTNYSLSGAYRLVGFALAVTCMLVWTTAVSAQSREDQYGTATAPSGPLAGESVDVLEDADGVANSGDLFLIEGTYTIADGSSVTLQDVDGTQGTLVDGDNANITEGSVRIAVTGAPVNAKGGDGVLGTDGLEIVATTGISVGQEEGANVEKDAAAGSLQAAGLTSSVLPGIGGPLLLAGLGVFALGSVGLMLRRRGSREL